MLRRAALVGSLLSWGLRPAASEEPRATVDAAIAELRANALKREQNLAKQEQLWPTREDDQRRELASPPAVQDLEERHRELLAGQREIEARIARFAPRERAHVWATAGTVTEPRDLDALLPIAVEAAGDDPSAAATLVALTRRFVPMPRSLVNALSRVGGEACGRLLLDHGKRLGDGALLGAAARTGEPSVLKALIDLADGKNGLRVVQLTSPETPGNQGFSPRPTPQLIATYKLHKGGHAVNISKGLDRDRAVDEAGNQLGVFGRIGARPFNLAEQQKQYLYRGALWWVSDDPNHPIYHLLQPNRR